MKAGDSEATVKEQEKNENERWSSVMINSSNTHPFPHIDPAPSLTQLQSWFPDPDLKLILILSQKLNPDPVPDTDLILILAPQSDPSSYPNPARLWL